jgi:secreted PhoX family phosphatase
VADRCVLTREADRAFRMRFARARRDRALPCGFDHAYAEASDDPDSGEAFFFARNDDPGDSEFTGPTFSQDEKILFANVQSRGYVCAIQGPFTKQR